ncbi:hypothetical protein CYMTET_33256, partial [Cymbomonas tetramitiformis]
MCASRLNSALVPWRRGHASSTLAVTGTGAEGPGWAACKQWYVRHMNISVMYHEPTLGGKFFPNKRGANYVPGVDLTHMNGVTIV